MKYSLLLITILCCFSINSNAQYGFDTVNVYYKVGQWHLDTSNKSTLDSLALSFNDTPRGIMIYAYADYLGKNKPNQILSEKRANTVSYYLMQKGIISSYQITVAGLGGVKKRCASCETGNPEFRKTQILIKRISPKPIEPTEDTTTTTAIDISNVKKNETFVLKNINFYEGSHQILPSSLPNLKSLLKMMNDNPTVKIRLEGHICCVTNYADATDIETGSLDLSYQRAKFVRDYLVANNISSDRIQYVGLGHKYPIIKVETTDAERKINRRVEVRILEK